MSTKWERRDIRIVEIVSAFLPSLNPQYEIVSVEYNPAFTGDHFVVEVTVRSIFDEYGRFPDPIIMMHIWLGETERIMYDDKMLDVVEVPVGKKAIFFSPRGNR